MMKDLAPDIYGIEFKDIYEIEFDDLGETAISTPDQSMPMVTDVTSTEETSVDNSGIEASHNHSASLAGSLALEPTITPVEVVSLTDPRVMRDAGVASEDTRTESLKPRSDIPEHVLAIADKAIQALIGSTKKDVVPLAQISDLAFGTRHGRDPEFGDFLAAIKQDPRLDYRGEQQYRIIRDRDDAQNPYWPGEQPHIDTNELAVLVVNAAYQMSESPGRSMQPGQVFGILKSLGLYLTADEAHEFFAILATHPNVTAHESGGFSYKPNMSFEAQTEGFAAIDRVSNTSDRPMTPRQISKTLKDIKYSSEFRKAQDEMKRLANPRRRGRKKSGGGMGPIGGLSAKKGYQGRSHGKKVTLDSLIADTSKKVA